MDVARRGDARVIDGLRAVLGAVRPVVVRLTMALTLIVGVLAVSSPAQAAGESYSASGTGIYRRYAGDYLITADVGVLFAGNSQVNEEMVSYATFTIPANKSYSSVNLSHAHSCNYGAGVQINFSLLTRQPASNGGGITEVRASTRFGGVVAGSGASVDSLPSSVVTEMNRLSAAGGGTLYLGVYAGTSTSVLCGFSTFNLVGETTSPAIWSVTPGSGPAAGNNTVTIAGNYLDGATSVTFGGTAGTNISATTNQITVTAPAGSPGAVNVVVTTPGGSATASSAYTYIVGPSISSISPNTGPTSGVYTVTINGNNLINATGVTFGGVPGAITGRRPNSLEVIMPALYTPRTVDVVVTGPGGTATLVNGFTAVDAPTITSVSPNRGPLGGTNAVIISGTNLAGASVTFGGSMATNVSASATTITANVPAHAAGAVNVVVTTAGGTATLTNGYTYAAAPTANAFTAAAVNYNTGSASTSPIELSSHVSGVASDYVLNNGGAGAGLITTAQGGRASVNTATGHVDYTPPVGFRGNDTFQYSVDGTTDWATVTVPVNNPVFTVTLPQTTGLYDVDYNPSNTPVTISGGKGAYTVTSVIGYPLGLGFDAGAQVLSGRVRQNGTWTVSFTITDSSTGAGPYTSIASATLVTTNPAAPTADPFTAPAVAYNTGSASATTIDLTAHVGGVVSSYNFNNGSGAPTKSITTAQGGSATVDNTGEVRYTPPVGFRGSDSFQFRPSNSAASGPWATVTVPVNNPVFTVTLPQTTGAIGVVYNPSNTPLTISGGKGPYTVTAATGYPRDLSFDAATQVLSGWVRQDGTWTTNFTITDSSTGAGAFTSTVSATLATTYPPLPTVAPFTVPAVAYNSGSASATAIDVAPHTSGVITGYFLMNELGGVGVSVPTLQGGSATININTGEVSYTAPSGFRGADSFQYRASNPGGGSNWATVTIPVSDPVFTVTLPSTTGVVGEPYNRGGAAVTVSGGKAPYSGFSATGLPAGLTMSSAGVISGTPTTATSATAVVTVTDSSTGTGAYTAPASVSLTIAAPTITLSPAPSDLPGARASVAYSQIFTATGGVTPITYALGGDLPTGLSLSTGGVLSGTPTQTGTFDFTVHATDGSGNAYSGSARYRLAVTAPTLSISPATIPAATQHSAYSRTLTASGGTPGYGFSLRSGDLPAGMTLSSGGVLSGTSTVVGTFDFTVRATDSTAGSGPFSVDAVYSLVVNVPAPPTVGDVSETVAANSSGNVFTLDLSGVPANSVTVDSPPAHGVATVSGMTIVYTPTAGYSGVDSFTYRAVNLGGPSAPATVTVTVSRPTLTLGDLPATGEALQSYGGTVTASLGAAPYRFALDGGSLPNGVSLDSGGQVSGSPTQAGGFSFTLRATDAYGATGTRSYSLNIAAPGITVGPAALPDGVSAVGYSQTLTASGAAAPYRYAVTAGGLPTGLTLSDGGVLSGVATASGTFGFTVTATDDYGFTGARAYSVTVADPVIAITAPAAGALPGGVGGTAYSQTFTATGGQGTHRFALATGTLPAGLTLSSGGVLSGTPTVAGTFDFAVSATDASSAPGPFVSTAVNYSLTVAAPSIILTPAAGALPGGLRTVAYSQALSATGGTASYGYAVTDGALPAGLTLAADGALSGTPSTAGGASFTVTATDAHGFTQSAAYTLEVGTPLAVVQTKIVSVIGGQTLTIDASQGATGLDLIEAQIATGPAHGTATVNGLIITYTANGTYAGQDSFTYTVSNPGGVSAPATVTITVNPAVAPGAEKTVTILAGQTATVELTEGAFGAPFTGAAVVSVAPSGAGTATIAGRTGEGGRQLYDLAFKPDNSFTGTATVLYTLSNAFTTSEPGKVTITVEARPDPVADPEVSGLITAQGEAARRFATAQIGNINRRLEQLHDGRGGGGFSSNLSLSSLDGGLGGGMAHDPSELRRMQDSSGVMGGLLGRGAGTLGFASGASSAPERRTEDLRTPSFGGDQQGEPGPWGVWVSGAATFGRADDGRDREGFKFSTDGLTIGADRRLGETLVWGGAIGWATDTSRIGDNGTRSEADAWSVSLYGGWQPDENTYVDLVLGYGRLDFDSRRYVTANGDFAYGQRDGDQWYGAMTAGWDYRHPQGLHLSPYGRIEATQSVLGSFTEEGGGLYALAYDEQTSRTVTGAIGLRGDYAFKSRFGQAMPSFRIEYSYDLQGSGSQRIRYADWLDGNVYSLAASPLDRNRMLYGLGLDLLRASGMRLGLGYEGMLSGDQTSSTLRVKMETQF